MHGSSFKSRHFVGSENLAMHSKDSRKLNKGEHYFILFLVIK